MSHDLSLRQCRNINLMHISATRWQTKAIGKSNRPAMSYKMLQIQPNSFLLYICSILNVSVMKNHDFKTPVAKYNDANISPY